MLALIDELFAAPIITISRAQEVLDVTFKAAKKNVAKLEAAGILRETTKKQRNRVYVADEILKLLDEGEYQQPMRRVAPHCGTTLRVVIGYMNSCRSRN